MVRLADGQMGLVLSPRPRIDCCPRPLGERVARGGVFISHRGTGEGVEVLLRCSLLLQPCHHPLHHFLGRQAGQLVGAHQLLIAE